EFRLIVTKYCSGDFSVILFGIVWKYVTRRQVDNSIGCVQLHLIGVPLIVTRGMATIRRSHFDNRCHGRPIRKSLLDDFRNTLELDVIAAESARQVIGQKSAFFSPY